MANTPTANDLAVLNSCSMSFAFWSGNTKAFNRLEAMGLVEKSYSDASPDLPPRAVPTQAGYQALGLTFIEGGEIAGSETPVETTEE